MSVRASTYGMIRLLKDAYIRIQTIFEICMKIHKCMEMLKSVYMVLSLARQAAVPLPRNYTEILSIRLRNTTEHLAEKTSKSSPNRSNNGTESMKQCPWNDVGAET